MENHLPDYITFLSVFRQVSTFFGLVILPGGGFPGRKRGLTGNDAQRAAIRKPGKKAKNFFEKGIDFIRKWRYNVKLYEIVALGGGM